MIKDINFSPYFVPHSLIKRTLAYSIDPDNTQHDTASDHGLHCLHLNTGFSIIHGNNKQQPDSPSFGNGSVQRVTATESI